ncbi:MAG: methionine--tRNA ligase [Dehalococcoidia bacterium]|nr:methionine--tRNA ligase [Dehalococcoidia bacterium]
MPEKILIAVAWPYANGWLHIGHIAGCYLPADIFARYHRLKGNSVLMVSGSDQHGTPVTIRADQEGITPAEVVEKYHQSFLQTWNQLGISFDLFTKTGTLNHRETTHEIFNTLLQRGYIYKESMAVPYCEQDTRFLPDRYVKGICPNCNNHDARGDQCDHCGHPMNSSELGNLTCRLCQNKISIRESEHCFLSLSKFENDLKQWLLDKDSWKPNVLNFTRKFLDSGLKDRAITRDIQWGIDVPIQGFENKRIYVWFEAVIGYLSASKEWSSNRGESDRWREWWDNPDAKSYYFIGKDNIPFHSIIWPAILMGFSDLNLPHDIPANEFLTMQGDQLSTSRNWAVWVPDFLERYEADPLRYYLSINMPETSDSDFTWDDFVRRNNDELVGTYGNLVNRVLTLIQKLEGGVIPSPKDRDKIDDELMTYINTSFEEAGKHLENCRFRQSIRTSMTLANAVNKYLEVKSPWKKEAQSVSTTLWTCSLALSALAIMTYPFLPFSAPKLFSMLGFKNDIQTQGWNLPTLAPGTAIAQPTPLFKKLDDKVAKEEIERMIGKA